MRRLPLPLPLLLAGLGLGLGEREPPAPSGAQCLEHDCFAVFWAPGPFEAASAACERHGGHLMTVRSTVAEDAIELLLRNRSGRLWLGLRLPVACTEPARKLRGFQWVTGDDRTDHANWAPSGRRCGQRCVTVSRELRWEERRCEEPAEGFLCEYNYPDSCPVLPPADGTPVSYRTPFGARGGDFHVLPPDSAALVPALGLELRCGAAPGGGGMRWGRAEPGAWPCRLANGGCEERCEEPGGRPRCSCPPGKPLGPDGRGCVSPCAGTPCQHHCVPDGAGFHCMCDAGYELGADGSSCRDVDDCAMPQQLCEQECHNTEGGFECRCFQGFEMVSGSCKPTTTSCHNAPCEHICKDVPGGYQCSCYSGYAVNPWDPNSCIQQCKDSVCPAECDMQGLSCYCPDGFVVDHPSDRNAVCIDVDECEMNYCEHDCINTPGSYICSCQPGYVVDGYNSCKPGLTQDEEGEYSGDSALPTPVPSHVPPRAGRLHPGALVGIAVGVLCAALALLALGYQLARKRCQPPASMEYKCGGPREKDLGLQQVPAGCAAAGQKL